MKTSKSQKRPYSVGFAKPPKDGQFKPGKSGNPAGRPKGSKGLRSTFIRLLNEKVRVTDGGSERLMPRSEVVVRKVIQKALEGDMKAVHLVAMMIEVDAERNISVSQTVLDAKVNEAILTSYFERMPIDAKKKK